ncbi:MAG: cobalamin-independent methionine synthase II family protein [Bryobacterales bacterium]|nr:cobalamin-independent methionine synthase II family protein [Bryobacterales bacterium]
MAIRTTVVGSYPIPRWLYGDTSKQTLRDAIAVVLQTQELAGIDLVADGELNRFDPSHPETNGMIDYFVRQLSGVQTDYSMSDMVAFQSDSGMAFRAAPAGVVREAIGAGTLNLPADYDFVKDLTDRPIKFTCTGPHMLSKTLTDRHYCSHEDLCMAVAEVLRCQLADVRADVVQLDEANITGHPEESTWAATAINHVLDGIKTTRAVHLCFGNYGGQRIQSGTWQGLLPYLNALHCDFVLLEIARMGYEALDELQDLNPAIGLGLSVIDIKDNQVESPDLIASRIEHAAKKLGEDRIQFVNPDCGFWMLSRSVADRKMRALVSGRDLYMGSN